VLSRVNVLRLGVTVDNHASRVEFRVLGSVEIWVAGRRLALPGRLQPGLVAALATRPNQVVSANWLTGALWFDRPPRDARDALHGQVWRVRRTLASGGAGADRLVWYAVGYLLRAAPDEIDAVHFRRLAETGRAALLRGEAAKASRLLRAALALWRGAPFDGLHLPALAQEVAVLQERRLGALQDRIDVDLRMARHTELIAELSGLVLEHPTRERLWWAYLVALVGAGRHADALEAYRQYRHQLVELTGTEPGPALQSLHRQILVGGPVLDAGSARVAAEVPVRRIHPRPRDRRGPPARRRG
jgi:DNA-binding SARP family transcriptional activator